MLRKDRIGVLAEALAKDLQMNKTEIHGLYMFLERCSDDLLLKASTESKWYTNFVEYVRQDQGA